MRVENEETTQEEPKSETQPVTAEMVREAPVPPRAVGAAALVKIGAHGVALSSLEDLVRFARMASASGLCPSSMTAEAAAIAIQAGLERGMTPIAALQAFVVIKGNLSVKGSAAHAMVENSPVCIPGSLRKFIEGEGEQMVGVAVAHRRGYAAPERRTYSVADAKRAGLWGKKTRNGDPTAWITNPERMLMWRAEGHLFSDIFPDVIGNFPLAEVAEDFAHQTVRGETPATRAAAGFAPPPGADPLLAIIDCDVVEPHGEGEE